MAYGQQAVGSIGQPAPQAVSGETPFPSHAEWIRQIAVYEDALKRAEASHQPDDVRVRLYASLATLYENVARYAQAEDAWKRAIALVPTGAQDELAEELRGLALLQIAKGDMRSAKENELSALKIRTKQGETVEVAKLWGDLADWYIAEKQFATAVDYARKALNVLQDDPKVAMQDRIEIRERAANALCGNKQSREAIPLLLQAHEIAKGFYGPGSAQAGATEYLLGHAYWQSRDMDAAAEWLERGVEKIKLDLGWGHPIYVNALTEYARFLRERGNEDAASAIEHELRKESQVVDVGSLAANSGASSSLPSR